jgi:hypothetical protein
MVVSDPGDDPRSVLAHAGARIVAGVERVGAAWAVREVDRILDAWGRIDATGRAEARVEAAAVGDAAAARVAADLRAVLARDPAEQTVTPLEVVRTIVREPTALLRRLGVPEVVRDEFDERMQPDDVYDLAPRTLADVDPELGPELLVWGVAKATLLRGRGQTGRGGAG